MAENRRGTAQHNLGFLLRSSRASQGISQLDLALRLNISQRHVSFVESGRTFPSRKLLVEWAHELGMLPSERNAALLQGGYALEPADGLPDDVQQALRLEALQTALDAHMPNPGMVFDAEWRVLIRNRGVVRVSKLIMPALLADKTVSIPVDLMEVIEHPGGLLSHARQPREIATALLAQLHAESWATLSLRSRIRRLEQALTQRFPESPLEAARNPSLPYLQLAFDTAEGPLSFIAIQSVFALPQDVTSTSLRLEQWLAADAHTLEVMRKVPPARSG